MGRTIRLATLWKALYDGPKKEKFMRCRGLIRPLGLMMCIVLGLSVPAVAKTDWQVLQSIRLEEPPIDVFADARRRQVYVLTKKGKIWIYTANGQLKGHIEVGKDVTGIKPGPREDLLYLLSPKSKNLRMINIEIVEEIPIAGAPYKGQANAAVTVVVFSDFQ
jgi:hypothetical protein